MTLRATVALPAVPAHEGGAAGRCALALLAGLRAHGVEVEAVAGSPDPASVLVPPAAAQVRVVPYAEPLGRWPATLARLRRPRGGTARGALLAEVQASARRTGLLHLEQVDTSWLDEGLDVPAVVHLHHLMRADRDLGRFWEPGFREVLEFAAGERAVYRRHRHLLASSPVVAAAARRANPALDVVEAPLSLLPETYPAVPLDGPPVAGLIGTGTWAPTARAIEAAVLQVWPQVLAQVPHARLQVAGRGVAALAALQEPRDGVEVLGEVASARDFLHGLSLLLYPLTRGSGMKVKVLESMASGLPVVTTPCGAEGLRPGDGVVVSDDPAVLIRETVELLRDPLARRQRGDAARAQFLAQHAPAVAAEPVVELYRRLHRG